MARRSTSGAASACIDRQHGGETRRPWSFHEREEMMTENSRVKVAVVGAGTMGPGMAATFARNGFDTALYDVQPEQLEKARGTVDFVYNTLTGGGFMTAEEADAG